VDSSNVGQAIPDVKVGIVNADLKYVNDVIENGEGLFRKFYRYAVSGQEGLERLAKASGDTRVDDYTQGVRSAKSTVTNIFNNGMFDSAGKKIDNKSYKDLIDAIPKKDREAFNIYAQHLHNIDRVREGVPVFKQYSEQQSQQIVNNLLKQHPEFANYTKDINEWWNKLDAMIQTEVSLQNETPAYQCLQHQIERLEAENYYNTPCLKNMINSYVCRTSGKKHIPLIYPSASLRLLTCLRSTSIDNFYIKNRYLGNTFLMNLYKKLPFLFKMEMLHLHRLAMFNGRERHQYVDVYQLDPDIYHEAHNSYKQNILKSHYSATLRLCIPTFFSHYEESNGYLFYPFVITESEPCCNYHIPLEATPIWDILQWTPEIAQKHPRYTATDRLNANVVQVSLKLAPPCKATYLNLQFVKGKIKRINYSVY
jgi:hypothetical protein